MAMHSRDHSWRQSRPACWLRRSPVWHRTRTYKTKKEYRLSTFKRTAGAALMTILLATVAVAQNATIDGEVKKIDQSSGSITLKHGPAPSLGIKEGMTMVYEVSDPA